VMFPAPRASPTTRTDDRASATPESCEPPAVLFSGLAVRQRSAHRPGLRPRVLSRPPCWIDARGGDAVRR
jgi:hypothetical protein